MVPPLCIFEESSKGYKVVIKNFLMLAMSSIYSKAHGRKYEILYIGHPSSNSSKDAAIHGYSLRVIKVGFMKCTRRLQTLRHCSLLPPAAGQATGHPPIRVG